MKKIIVSLFLLGVLSGCSMFDKEYYFVQNQTGLYYLVDEYGEKQDEETYDGFQELGSGYIVYQGEKYGYLDAKGEVVLELQEYDSFALIDDMMVTTKDAVHTTYNSNGELIYKDNEEVFILVYDLPVIKNGSTYTIIYDGGKTLGVYEEPVTGVSVFGETVLVNTANVLYCYELAVSTEPTKYVVEQESDMNYVICDVSSNKGTLIYDITSSKFCLLSLGQVVFSQVVAFSEENFDAYSSVYFDEGDNIIVSKEGLATLYDDNGVYVTNLNSYYNNPTKYIKKSLKMTYGPHTIYNEGTSIEIEDVQLDPVAGYIGHTIYPVYLRGKGYVYYDFNGEQVFEEVYVDVSSFDVNGLALVSFDENEYFFINTDGIQVGDEYVNIEWISGVYYKAFVSENRYIIIDTAGNQLLTQEFMGAAQVVKYNEITYGIFENSGRTYVYDMTNEYALLLEVQGDVVFDSQGLFVVDFSSYYTLLGKNLLED